MTKKELPLTATATSIWISQTPVPLPTFQATLAPGQGCAAALALSSAWDKGSDFGTLLIHRGRRLLPAPAPSLAGGQRPDGRGSRTQSWDTLNHCLPPSPGWFQLPGLLRRTARFNNPVPAIMPTRQQEADLAVITSYTTSAWMD